jgi:hypothetical protein
MRTKGAKDKQKRKPYFRKPWPLECRKRLSEIRSKCGIFSGHFRNQHPVYTMWQSMKGRCRNPNNRNWRWYGARGITVCPEWQNDMIGFGNWALENGWQKGLQIDRIDNNGNYEPDNCHFVTREENLRNRRTRAEVRGDNNKKIL